MVATNDISFDLLEDQKRGVFTAVKGSKSIVHIYCPQEDIPQIKAVMRDYPLNISFNTKNKNYYTDAIVLHHYPSRISGEIKSHLLKKVEYGFKIMPLVDFLDKANGYTDIRLINGDYFLRKKEFSVLRSKRKVVVKRISDICYSLGLIALTWPILLLTAIAIMLESKGGVFFKQKRVGLYNKEFDVFKFRSMTQDAEKNGAQWAQENDPRITKVGKFIRRTRIDELPQLFNVLKGDMSLIGPRPERSVFIKELKKHIPYYEFRHAVKPGVTGWAQVKYSYGASVEDAKWKHKYDLYYIKYQSSMFDLKILLYTIKTVLFGMGR